MLDSVFVPNKGTIFLINFFHHSLVFKGIQAFPTGRFLGKKLNKSQGYVGYLATDCKSIYGAYWSRFTSSIRLDIAR